MKSIENKETTIENVGANNEHNGNCKYSHLISVCVKKPKLGGYDWVDQENRLTILKVVNEHPEIIELEDSYFKYLKDLVKTATFGLIHEDLIKFKDDILSIK